MRIVKAGLWLVLAAVAALAGWLYAAPPELIRVGSNYAAKIVCSNVFIAGRDPQAVLQDDVQAPGHPMLRLMRVSVDREGGVVRAGLFGLFGGGLAVYRDGAGCAAAPDGDIDAARIAAPEAGPRRRSGSEWPHGDTVTYTPNMDLDAVLNDEALTGPGMRAVVVVKGGRIVGERYGEGFGPDTPLLGWSMTKTVTAAIVGRLIREGRLALEQDGLLDAWASDGRDAITIADLLAMTGDLEWNEGYGDVSDVTRMLYLEPDMADFASGARLNGVTRGGPGDAFSYSSGTSVLLSRIWQNAFDDPAEALAWPREALFEPLGMRSAVLEADARGTFVGSSYMYATARDWARFGQFLAQRGAWNGRSLLPVGYVDWMTEPHPASGGEYGRGHVWLVAPNGEAAGGEEPELPAGVFFLSGHDGQSVTVVPSEELVVVRMGLTPSERGYRVARLAGAVIAALGD